MAIRPYHFMAGSREHAEIACAGDILGFIQSHNNQIGDNFC